MGVPGAARIERIRQPTTISVSARCARISATDHFSGAGRLRSLEGGALLTRRASFWGVADCVLKGSFPAIIFMMRSEYCCGVSLIIIHFPRRKTPRDLKSLKRHNGASEGPEKSPPAHRAW